VVVLGVEIETHREVHFPHRAETQVGLEDLPQVEVGAVDHVDFSVAGSPGSRLPSAIAVVGIVRSVGRGTLRGGEHIHVEEVGAVVPAVDTAEFDAVLDLSTREARIAELVAVLIAEVGVAPVGGADGERGQGDKP